MKQEQRGESDHGNEETEQPQMPLFEGFFTCCVFCFEIVRLKCFSFTDAKGKGKE